MATTSTTLTDDLLREIFLRLPSPEVLMHAVLTCKAWLRAARDAGFLRCFHALHPLSHIIGFFFNPSPLVDQPASFFFDPAMSCWSDAIAARDLSLSFLPGDGVSPNNWCITACHDGCILLENLDTEEFMVADPLSRLCFRTPPPPADLTIGILYVQVCNFVAYRGSDQSFQVLRLVKPLSSMRVGVFSSITGAWHCLQLENRIIRLLRRTHLYYCAHIKQSMYWITNSQEHMVEFDMTTMEFSKTSLPADLCACFPKYACAADCGDTLQEGAFVVYPVSTEDGMVGVLVAMRNLSHVKLWVRREDGSDERHIGGWVLEMEVMLHEELQCITRCSSNVCLSVVGASRGMVFLVRSGYRDELLEASYAIFMSLRLKTMELKMIRVVEGDIVHDGFQPYETLQPPPFLDPDRQTYNMLSENSYANLQSLTNLQTLTVTNGGSHPTEI